MSRPPKRRWSPSPAAVRPPDLIAAIRECGQNPVTQLSGYLITEDPTYLPEGVSSRGVSARSIARRVGRDKLLATLIELYLNSCTDLE